MARAALLSQAPVMLAVIEDSLAAWESYSDAELACCAMVTDEMDERSSGAYRRIIEARRVARLARGKS